MTDPTIVSQEEDGTAWDAFLSGQPDATVEHLWGWREVFRRAFGHDCVYLSARAGNSIVGVLPLVRYRSALFGRFLVSLPYFNYAGIVANDDSVVSELAAAAEAIGRQHGAKHVEFRHRQRKLPQLPATQNKMGFSRELPGSVEALWTSIDRKLRNQVRKAQNAGLTSVTGGAELIDDFYEVYARNMRDLGTPVFPKAFMLEAARAFPDRFTAFVVRHRGGAVAGAITLAFRDTILLPWASSLREYNALCGNVLLYWSIAERAVNAGAKTLDFGRSTPNSGPQRYKEQWGAVGRSLYNEYLLLSARAIPEAGPANPRLRLLIRAWQRLPVRLATRLGPAIVKHVS